METGHPGLPRQHGHGGRPHRSNLGTLEDSKYADNTIIVLWSDHGFQLGEKGRWGKYSLWERATRVNLMWVAPGVTTPGMSPTSRRTCWIYPTLASLTGLEPPELHLPLFPPSVSTEFSVVN